jgi:streptomycin 6-kinase
LSAAESRLRLDERVAAWRLVVDRVVETESSILAFGWRTEQPVVLKVVRVPGDEWNSGEILHAFGGCGAVRVLERSGGAMLLEQVKPGTPLVRIAVDDDERATAILAEVIGSLSPAERSTIVPTIEEWGHAFERYVSSGDHRIPPALLGLAQRVFSELCASQSATQLLHGDLHHYNVLLDSERGWLAIDPKGVVGEPAYEVGAALRNPYERPDLFTSAAAIERRVKVFERVLRLDAGRMLAWTFAQAVLSLVWAAEDGEVVGPDHPCITLANTIRPMLGESRP